MANWLNLGEMLKLNAWKYPDTVCLMDAERTYTFPQSNQRACRLANALLSLGLKKGDKVTSIGGICGTVVEVRDDELVVKVDENNNIRLRFSRWAIRGTGEQAKNQGPEENR